MVFAILASSYTVPVDLFPLDSNSINGLVWNSTHSSAANPDEKLLGEGSRVTSFSSLPSASASKSHSESPASPSASAWILPAQSLERKIPPAQRMVRVRRTPTESTSWTSPSGHSNRAGAQQVELQQVNQSPQSLESGHYESQNYAAVASGGSGGGGHSSSGSGSASTASHHRAQHLARLYGDEESDMAVPSEPPLLLDLSSLDVDTMVNMLNLIKNDPDTFNELIGYKTGPDSVVSSSGKSRNSRNRAAYEADVLQKVLQVYHDKVAPKLVLAKRGEGPQLSVVSPLDVLRQQLLYELARRRSKELQEKIQVNEQLLKSLGKRSVDPNDGPDDSPHFLQKSTPS